jgi:hypothetical protein
MEHDLSMFARISLLLISLQLPAAGQQQIFNTAPNYPVGSSPRYSATGDFNGDGKLDLAVVNTFSKNVSILFGNGDGTLQAAVTITAGPAPQGIAIADVNGDGKPDLVVQDLVSGVVVLLGKGDGTFGTPTSFPAGPAPVNVTAADLNGDGKTDLVVMSALGTVNVLLGKGDGTFGAPAPYTVGGQGTFSDTAVVADVNGDGKMDLVFDNPTGNAFLLLGNGDGTFQTVRTLNTGGPAWGIAVGDLNGDGKPDLVTTNGNSVAINVMLATGNGNFAAPVSYSPAGNFPRDIRIVDVNNDGKPDLVVANSGSNDAAILLGNGDGTFQSAMTFLTGSAAATLIVGDLNGDGSPDLISSNTLSNSITVLINMADASGTFKSPRDFQAHLLPVALATGNLNGDSFGDVVVANSGSNDVSVLLGNGDATFKAAVNYPVGSAPSDVALADVNHDGILDILTANVADNSVSVLFGKGDGSFGPAASYAIGKAQTPTLTNIKLITGFFSSAGQTTVDVVTQDSVTGAVVLMQGNSDGTLKAPIQIGQSAAEVFLAKGDFNLDGIQDIIIADDFCTVEFPFNPGTPPKCTNVGSPITAVERVSDTEDIYAAGNPSTVSDCNINSDGSFGTCTAIPEPGTCNSLTSGNLNGQSFSLCSLNNDANNKDSMILRLPDGHGGFRTVNLNDVGSRPTITRSIEYLPDEQGVATLSEGGEKVIALKFAAAPSQPLPVDLAVTITAVPVAAVGDTVTFTVTLTNNVTNNGQNDAGPATVVVSVPPEFDIQSTELPQVCGQFGLGCGINFNTRLVDFTLQHPLPAGASASAQISIKLIQLGTGTTTVTATITKESQPDTNLLNNSDSQGITINKGTPVITWPKPSPINFGKPLTSVQLNATASVKGNFTYSPAAGSVLSAGTQTLSVTFTPTDTADFTAATETVTLLVNKPGDLNGDGAVDCADMAIVKGSFGKLTGQPGFDPRADVNNDGRVDIRDLSAVAKQLPAGTSCH